MRVNTHENWARVLCHLNGGFLRVEMTDAVGDRFNMPNFEVPTDNIPLCALSDLGFCFGGPRSGPKTMTLLMIAVLQRPNHLRSLLR